MRLVQLEDYAEHYARTLAHWRSAFDNQIDEILARIRRAFPADVALLLGLTAKEDLQNANSA